MSERTTYEPGVPCWVDTFSSDPEAAGAFYAGLFGWELEGPAPMPGGSGGYYVARLRGRDAAGIGSGPADGARPPSSWVTSVAVASADDAAARAREAGGQVVGEPFDVPPAGRLAVLVDPAGAMICAWEAGSRQGAQVVNEPGAWAMSLLTTPDLEGAEAFYGALFGWTVEAFGEGPDAPRLFRLPGYAGGEPAQPVSREVVATMARAPEGAPLRWNADFWVEDADAATEAVTRLGGRVLGAPEDSPVGRTTQVEDPLGVSFSVSHVVVPG